MFSKILISGIVNGSIYSLLGLAIIIIYRTTSVANFAQGVLGAIAVYFFLFLFGPIIGFSFLSLILAITFAAIFSVACYVFAIRPNSFETDPLTLTVRTLGLYLLAHSLLVYFWSAGEPYPVPDLFSGKSVDFLGILVSYNNIAILSFCVIVASLFFALFRYTRFGLAMRATAFEPNIVPLVGINVDLIAAAAWAFAGAVAGFLALSVSPTRNLESALMMPYLINAFIAAIIGGLSSFPGVIFGGIILGFVESVANISLTNALRTPLIFALLLIVLLFKPEGLFARVMDVRV